MDRPQAGRPRLQAPGDILLVSCYEPGYQPLAVASPAAFLTQAGYAPLCLDLAVEDLQRDGIDRLTRARLVAISVPMHTALTLGLRVAERVRALNPSAHICFYGLYAHLNAAFLKRSDGGGRPLADTVFGPECEESLVALANGLRDGRPASASATRLHRLAFLPPAREHLPPLEKYARLLVGGERRVTGHVEATRGCLYLCRHCPIPPYYQGRFFAVPAELVLDDIRRQVAAGARHITFGDPDFLNSAKHSLAIVRRMHAEHPEITFSFTAKVEHIITHRDIFPELARLGCVFMVSAVESLSDRVLEILDKRHSRNDVHAVLQIVRGAGLSLRPTFVAFTPWTTLDDYIELCELVTSHDLHHEVDPVQLAIRLLIPPGSLLLDRPELAPIPGARAARRTIAHPPLDAPRSPHGSPVRNGRLRGRGSGAGRRGSRRHLRTHPRDRRNGRRPTGDGDKRARRPRPPAATASQRTVVLLRATDPNPVGPNPRWRRRRARVHRRKRHAIRRPATAARSRTRGDGWRRGAMPPPPTATGRARR